MRLLGGRLVSSSEGDVVRCTDGILLGGSVKIQYRREAASNRASARRTMQSVVTPRLETQA